MNLVGNRYSDGFDKSPDQLPDGDDEGLYRESRAVNAQMCRLCTGGVGDAHPQLLRMQFNRCSIAALLASAVKMVNRVNNMCGRCKIADDAVDRKSTWSRHKLTGFNSAIPRQHRNSRYEVN